MPDIYLDVYTDTYGGGAVAALTTQVINNNPGLIGTGLYVTPGGSGDTFMPGDRTYLHVKNANGSSITVTVHSPTVGPAGTTIADKVYTVANNAEAKVGPFPGRDWADAANSFLGKVTCSATSSVLIGAFSL